MNDFKKSMPLKTAAFIAALLCVVLFLFSFIGCLKMVNMGVYILPKTALLKNEMSDITYNYAYEVVKNYHQYHDSFDGFYESGYNFYFDLTDGTGNALASTNKGEKYRFYNDYTFILDEDSSYIYEYDDAGYLYRVGEKEETNEYKYNIRIYVKEEFTASDRLSEEVFLIDFAYYMRYTAVAVGIVSFILGLVLYIYLLCSVGHSKESDEIRPRAFDKIPFDILTAAFVLIIAGEVAIINELTRGMVRYILIAVMVAADSAIAMEYVLSFACRLKTSTFLRNNFILIAAKWFVRVCKKLGGFIIRAVSKLPAIWRTVIILGAYLFAELFFTLLFWGDADIFLMCWLTLRFVLAGAVLYAALVMKKLKSGSEKIAGGDLDYRIDTSKMLFDFKEYGETLNNIGGGLSAAVDEKMKSERMKTELITNVSHDIKTPITSIINYVNLLEKEDIQNERAREYIDVLDRQSSRLKKLVEDLVEASKASTGNISVNLEYLDVGILLDQTVGEYNARAEKVNLRLLLTKPEEPVIIRADGRHMWRIFDNLMSNICKYAQENTRVYLSLERRNGKAIIVFKNISKYQLNISGDELVERFVQGDSSRSTEGSGLGLSIARSLMELQGGRMNVLVDGDLFKAILVFDEIQ